MDPITILALICIFALVTLVVSDYRDYHEDEDAPFNTEPAAQPIPLNRGPRDVA
jgi:hypothetical protein